MVSSEEAIVQTLQQIDRLVSTSSPSDALDSLQALTQLLQTTSSSSDSAGSDNKDVAESIIATLVDSTEFTTALCSLLSDSQIGTMTVEDGNSEACECLSTILTYHLLPSTNSTTSGTSRSKASNSRMMTHLKRLLSQPSDGALIHGLIDILSPSSPISSTSKSNSNPTIMTNLYAKTKALEILGQLTLTLPTLVHSQILTAPDGLHRIVDLLSIPTNSEQQFSEEEICIRDDAIRLCTNLAKTSAASARLMIFSETYEKILLGIARGEFHRGNKGGYAVVADCLRLCIEMTKRDGMGSEVFLGSRNLVATLAEFLDLRVIGEVFHSPARMVESTEETDGENSGDDDNNNDNSNATTGENEDDLDAILNGGMPSTKASSSIEKAPVSGNGQKKNQTTQIPYLTKDEATVVQLTLEFLDILIAGDGGSSTEDSTEGSAWAMKRQTRQRSILSHEALSCLLFDMALYTLPPPDAPPSHYLSAVPPLKVQLTALNVITVLIKDSGDELNKIIFDKKSVYLQHVSFLERVMYLICTGGGVMDGASEISMHALGVLRCALTANDASVMMLHTLAPPPPEESSDAQPMQDEIPVVQKLVNTLGENLQVLLQDTDVNESENGYEKERRHINIIGASGALGVFLTNGAGETTREMLLRVPLPPLPTLLPTNQESSPPPSPVNIEGPSTLIDCILLYLEKCCSNDMEFDDETDVPLALLRLLIEWTPSCPRVISELLSNASSVSLGVIIQKKRKKGLPPTIQAFTSVLIGLCLENIQQDDTVGGWSRESIMNLINVGLGVSKFTQLLESLKPYISNSSTRSPVGPWTLSLSEKNALLKWYEENVDVVRRSVVNELTMSNSVGESDEEEEEDVKLGSAKEEKNAKSLSKLVSQQSNEIESLRQQLLQSEKALEKKSVEVNTWKKRMESNPTQLDDMLNDYSSKVSELEQDIDGLNNEMTKKDVQYRESLQQKDGNISQLMQDLEQLRGEAIDIRRERDMIQEELTGLSTAYNNLENLYNSVNSAGTSSGEDSEQQGTQAIGDSTVEASKSLSEYEALKNENTRLKGDVCAANEWMSKAVKKIDDLGKRNTEVEAEIRQLKSQKDFDASKTIAVESKELESLRENMSLLETHLNETQKERDNLFKHTEELQRELEHSKESQELQESETHRLELSRQVETIQELKQQKDYVQNQLSEAMQKIQDGADDISKLTTELDILRKANTSAQEWMANAVKHNESLKGKLEEANNRNKELISDIQQLEANENSPPQMNGQESKANRLQIELDQANENLRVTRDELDEKEISTSKALSDNEQEVTLLSNEILSLKEKLLSREDEIQSLHLNIENDPNRLELSRQVETIEELKRQKEDVQNQLSKAMQKIQDGADDISELTTELDILRNANTSAQEWMANAVKQNESLKGKLEEANNANQQSPSQLDGLKNRTEALQVELDEANESLRIARDELEEKEISISKAASVDDEKVTLLSNEIKSLKEELLSREDEIQSLQGNAEIIQQGSDLEKKRFTADMDQIHIQLNEKSNFINKLQDEISVLRNDNESLEAERDEQLLAVSEVRSQLGTLQEENQTLRTDRGGHEGVIQQIRAEVKSEMETLQEDNETLHNENKSNEETIKNMQTRLAECQDRIDSTQTRINDFEAEKVEMQNRLESVIESEKCATEGIEAMESEIQTLKDDIALKTADGEESRSNLENMEANVARLEDEIEHLKNMNSELNQKILDQEALDQSLFDKENKVTELEGELAASWKDLEKSHLKSSELQQMLNDKDEEIKNEREKVEAQIEDERSNTNAAKLEWDQHRTILEEDITDLRNEKDEMVLTLKQREEELSSKQSTINTHLQHIECIEKQKAEVEKEKRASDSNLQKIAEELKTSIEKYASTIDDLQCQVEVRDENISEAEERISVLMKELVESGEQSEEVVLKWQENNEQQEATIAELEITIESQNKEANEAIGMWEERCNVLVEKVEELENELEGSEMKERLSEAESLLAQRDSDVADAQSQIEKMKGTIADLESLPDTLSKVEKAKNEIYDKLQEEKNKLEEAIELKQELEQSLATQTELLAHTKTAKDQALADLKEEAAKSQEYKIQLSSAEKSIQSLEDKIRGYENNVMGLETKMAGVEKSHLETESQRQELMSQVQALEDEANGMKEAIENYKVEIDELRLANSELDHELQEVNETLQSHLTDEVSFRATEMATQALRVQVKELREKQMNEYDEFLAEKERRVAAEEEVKNLKSDLAVFIQLEDESDTRIKMLTSKAASDIAHKEREEIKSLQDNLSRVMKELQMLRTKERDSEERAANSRLQASMAEQELMACKSDLTLLKQAMDESKIDETNIKTSLELRIKDFETKVKFLTQSHLDEVETFKAENSQLQMEKERLSLALHDSEKANATLVRETTLERDEEDETVSDEMELSRLKLENAQLLNAASQNASKLERRIREAVAANAAAVESEMIVEKDLRKTAESELMDLKKRYDELQAMTGDQISDSSEAEPSNDTEENDLLKQEIETAKEQNLELTTMLRQFECDSKNEIARLEEKLRLSETKVRELQRKGHMAASVAVEVARIRTEASPEENGKHSEDTDMDEKKEMFADELYEVVLQQSGEIREEREMYRELLEEHDDLLALLAQKDLERECLQSALLDHAGQDAVEKAIMVAEDKAYEEHEQFGNKEILTS